MEKFINPLDITHLEPHQKCLSLFKNFDALRPGESFIVAYDQDPIYLYHHLMEAKAEPFSWERLENGPLRWQVRITKSLLEEGAIAIGKLATEDYVKAEVFQRLGIPYCCAGKKTLKEACEEAGIRQDILEQFYAEASRHKAKEVYAFEKWETSFLADYIVRTHHTFVRQNVQEMLDLAALSAQEQDRTLPEIETLIQRLKTFLSNLVDHMREEERLIFPKIKEMTVRKKKNKVNLNKIPPELSTLIQKLEVEHQQAGKDLKFFRKLTRNYRLPPNAGESLTHLYAKLLEFENDLVQHIHLENNLLFPKAIALEKELTSHRPKVFVKQIFPVS